jgi:hypothetical protein
MQQFFNRVYRIFCPLLIFFLFILKKKLKKKNFLGNYWLNHIFENYWLNQKRQNIQNLKFGLFLLI